MINYGISYIKEGMHPPPPPTPCSVLEVIICGNKTLIFLEPLLLLDCTDVTNVSPR